MCSLDIESALQVGEIRIFFRFSYTRFIPEFGVNENLFQVKFELNISALKKEIV